MIKSILRSFIRPISAPTPIQYPFLWIDRYSTIWLRTCAGCSSGSRDVCLQRGDQGFDVGDITHTVTSDSLAWNSRMRSDHILELSNTTT